MTVLLVTDRKTMRYAQAWDLQKELIHRVDQGLIPDQLMYVNHPHVYTTGRRLNPNHILITEEECLKKEIEICNTDRGGLVTYHGPGQIIGYPIVKSMRFNNDAHMYLNILEECIIEALAAMNIQATHHENHRGVWVGNEKIASIGVKFNKSQRHGGYVTSHGFALNVTTDLSYFHGIIPCGLAEGMTSVKKIRPDIQWTAEIIAQLKISIAKQLAAKLMLKLMVTEEKNRNLQESSELLA